MVTARKIRCVVVVASPEKEGMNMPSPIAVDNYSNATSYQTKPRFRPSDLLPWADPHIRSLVEELQADVREEVAAHQFGEVNPPAAESLVGDDLFSDEWAV